MSSHNRTWPALDVAGLPPADAPDAHDAVQGDLLEATLTDFDVEAIDESAPVGWRVFFRTHSGRDRAQQAIAREFPALTLTAVDVPDEDWAARSQASLKAVRVGNLIVAPPWDAPIVVAIRPSMGFGTGHHVTTRLCLEALQAMDLTGCDVLDVGTGSGVLAIASVLLGAVRATGIDSDADALSSAHENLAVNPSARGVTLAERDLTRDALPAAAVVTANLTGALLVRSADTLASAVRSGGALVLSGILAHERNEVRAAFPAMTVAWEHEDEGWVGLVMTKS